MPGVSTTFFLVCLAATSSRLSPREAGAAGWYPLGRSLFLHPCAEERKFISGNTLCCSRWIHVLEEPTRYTHDELITHMAIPLNYSLGKRIEN